MTPRERRLKGSAAKSDGAGPRLVVSAAEPPPSSIEEALEVHLDAMYGLARATCGDPSVAEDVVQEAAIRAARAWATLREPGAARTWLLRIVHRSALNHLRAHRRGPQLVDIDLDALIADPTLADGDRDLVLLGAVPLSDRMEGALAVLPEAFREAIWLCEVEELTIAEAAEITGLPPGTVASRLHRARRLLRLAWDSP
jgi:RNA polymerase sigma factor (sigma-70 family)